MAAGWFESGGAAAGIESNYLKRVADDIRLILGAGIEIDAVEIVDAEPDDAPNEPRSGGEQSIGLRARYHLGGRTFETTAPGESLLDAHRRLRARLIIDRLRLSFSDTVDPISPR